MKAYHVTVVLCVIGIAIGQVLFKRCAQLLSASGTIFNVDLAITFVATMVLYGLATLGWIWSLQHVPLNYAYPFMALAFVLVPLMSYFAFGEQVNGLYLVGLSLIVGGIVVIGIAQR